MSAIEYREVSFAYPDAPRPSLAGVELDVAAGEVLVVAGPSGSGKSTLLRCANGLVPHATGGRFGGDVVAFGRSTRSHHPRELADVVGFVHQDPEAQFVVDRVETDVAFVLENLGVPADGDAPARRGGARRPRHRPPARPVAGDAVRRRAPAVRDRRRPRSRAVGARARRAHFAARPPGCRRRARRGRLVSTPTSARPCCWPSTASSGPRRWPTAPCSSTAAIVGGPGAPAPCSAATPARRPVTRLGRLLGWDPLPLTVRDAAPARRRNRARSPPPTRACRRVLAGRVLVAGARPRVSRSARHDVLHGVIVDVAPGEVVALLGRNGAGKTTLLRALARLVAPTGAASQAPRRRPTSPRTRTRCCSPPRCGAS